ncbi:MAG: hypothetical protein U9O55_03660 [Patescibacteria group bacterium]|nr:hypothetical protein [Patescibacteria group bacterium]
MKKFKEKKSEVKIVKITSCGDDGTYIFGLGDDQKIYEWDEYERKWRYEIYD